MSPELVAEELYKDSILTLEMKETILMQLTRFAKNRKMLDIVPKRGQRAFHSFCLALEKAGQSHLSIGLREEHINGAKESTRNQDTATNLSSWKRPSKNYTQLCMIDLGDDIYVTANRYDQDNTVQIHLRQYTREGKKQTLPNQERDYDVYNRMVDVREFSGWDDRGVEEPFRASSRRNLVFG